ncbi:CBS domain-containing protein [Arthrobacter sp.]|uniref:CBS domain-containing protein n=1 Tax=Arthrobacter sp. TaxID=1667 RepID=UPI00281165F6|nr:CBS domain-containing protein [Arthrobacter sp.]
MLETVDPSCVKDAMITCPKTLPADSSVEEVRRFFADDHVHLALIVDSSGRLLTTLERSDIPSEATGSAKASGFGTIHGRTIEPQQPLGAATASLQLAGRRRLAVVDDEGKLLGLLCRKRTGLGYCNDAGVAARAAGLEMSTGGSLGRRGKEKASANAGRQ